MNEVVDYSLDTSEASPNGLTLHELLVQQTESLRKKTKRRKRMIRTKWYRFYSFIKQQAMLKEYKEYLVLKKKQRKEASYIASTFVVQNIDFSTLIRGFGKPAKEFMRPLVELGSLSFTSPSVEDYSKDIALYFSLNLDFISDINDISNDLSNNINNIDTFQLIRKNCVDANDPIYDVSSEVVARMNLLMSPLSATDSVTPLRLFPQDCLLLTELSRMEVIADQIAEVAVQKTDFISNIFKFGEILPTLRPFLRLSYPRWDNEVPLVIEKGNTLASNSLTTFFDSVSIFGGNYDSDISGTFLAECKTVIGDLDPLVPELVERIIPVIVEQNIWRAINPDELIVSSINEVASHIASDPDQDVQNAAEFMQTELRRSLAQFCGSMIGADAAVMEFKSFQDNFTLDMVRKLSSFVVFGNINGMIHFIKGAADQKRHKISKGTNELIAIKDKESVMNSIKEILD